MFDDLKDSIAGFSEKAKKSVAEKEVTEELLEDVLWELEQGLLKNNVAVEVIDRLKEDMKEELVGESLPRGKAGPIVHEAFKKALLDVLEGEEIDFEALSGVESPVLVLFMGFNGSGKTTTLAKVAHMLQQDGHSVVLAAGDTFRSASIEQLKKHADSLGVNCVSHDYGADPAAVIYDAVEHAEKEGTEFVLADTAGRSHADRNLMQELQKIAEVNSPDLKLLVVDALSGNDVLRQAEAYEKIGFDALVLAKADADTKGGAALSLGYVTGKPILFLGTGQDYEDLEEFGAGELVEELLG